MTVCIGRGCRIGSTKGDKGMPRGEFFWASLFKDHRSRATSGGVTLAKIKQTQSTLKSLDDSDPATRLCHEFSRIETSAEGRA